MKKIDFTKFDSLISVADYFDSEKKCKQTLAESRWGDDVVCPKCSKHHCKLSKTGRYHCTECNHNFSVTVGTIFENTKVSLRKRYPEIFMKNYEFNLYGLCSYSEICNLPDDIKPDWLEAAEQMLNFIKNHPETWRKNQEAEYNKWIPKIEERIKELKSKQQ